MPDGTVGVSFFYRDGRGIVPEIQPVDRFVIHPQTRMVRMVGTFTCFWPDRVAPGYGNAIKRIERKEKWFPDRVVVTGALYG